MKRYFKKKQKNDIKIKKTKVQITQVNNISLLINIFGVLIIIIGCSILYYRMKNKEENKRKNTQRIIQFYHDIN